MSIIAPSYPGYVNASAKITQDKCGITLLNETYKYKEKLIDRLIPHCKILVEEVDDIGEHVGNIVELNTYGDCGFEEGKRFLSKTVASTYIRAFKPDKHLKDVKSKTQTWLLTKRKAQKFIDKMKKQNGKEYPYSLFGSSSVLSDESALFEIYHPILAAVSRADRQLFRDVYDSSRNNGLYTGRSVKEFDVAIAAVMHKIRTQKPKDRTHNPNQLEYITDADSYHLTDSDIEYDYEKLVYLAKCFVKDPQRIRQESCISWARKQCKALKIPQESGFYDYLDKLLMHPALHCPKKMDEVVVSDATIIDDSSDSEEKYDREERLPSEWLVARDLADDDSQRLVERHVANGYSGVGVPEDLKWVKREGFISKAILPFVAVGAIGSNITPIIALCTGGPVAAAVSMAWWTLPSMALLGTCAAVESDVKNRLINKANADTQCKEYLNENVGAFLLDQDAETRKLFPGNVRI
jgi:hypothetical protein